MKRLLLAVLSAAILAAVAPAQNPPAISLPLPDGQWDQAIFGDELFAFHSPRSSMSSGFTVVDLKTKTIVRSFQLPYKGTAFCLSRDGQIIWPSYDGRDLENTSGIRIIDPQSGRIVQYLRHNHLAFLPGNCAVRADGSILVVSGNSTMGDPAPKISTLRPGPGGYQYTESWPANNGIGGVVSVVCASVKDVCFAGYQSIYGPPGKVIVIENGKPVKSLDLTVPAYPSYPLAVSPDGKVAYVPVWEKGTLRLSAETFEWLEPWPDSKSSRYAFSGDPGLAYVLSYGTTVITMDMGSKKSLGYFNLEKQGETIYDRMATSLLAHRQTGSDLLCILFKDELRLVEAGRVPELKALTDAAAFQPKVAVGSLVTFWGRSMFPWQVWNSWENGRLPRQTHGCAIKVGGPGVTEQALPLLYVSPNQVNALLPTPADGLPFGITAEFWVECNGQASAKMPFKVEASAPGLFAFPDQQPKFTYSSPGGQWFDSPEARTGTDAAMWATGLGQTNPPVSAGLPFPAQPLAVVEGLSITLADRPVEVKYSGGAPGYAGLYQLNIKVPPGCPLGAQKLRLTTKAGDTIEYSVTVTGQ